LPQKTRLKELAPLKPAGDTPLRGKPKDDGERKPEVKPAIGSNKS
jgi:hypothetical protein